MPLTQVSSRLIEDTLRYVLGASGTDHYTFTGKGLTGAVNDPTLTLSRGHTYIFENRNSSGAHPFYIKTSIANGGTNDAYNTGVTNNGGAGGTEIVFTVPHDAPDLLYYQCSSHSNMAGQLKIAGAVADGSITEAKLADDAVTADKLADSINTAIAANTAKTSNATHTGDVTGSTSLTIANDAVTNAKIAANAVGTTEIADNAVTTTKIPDEGITLAKLEHGTSSNDGKFLRANNGADPTFETVPSPSNVNTGSSQVLEQFLSPCDGSVIALSQGDTTITNVTTVQNPSTSYADVNGSSITYTPPTGTKQVIYEFNFHGASKDAHGIGTLRLYLDNVDVTSAIFSFSADKNFDMQICFKWSFNIGGTADASVGRVATWTSGKTIKLRIREYGGSNESKIFQSKYTDGSTSGSFSRPCLGITAIGAPS